MRKRAIVSRVPISKMHNTHLILYASHSDLGLCKNEAGRARKALASFTYINWFPLEFPKQVEFKVPLQN
jgi:hypothetical protein